MRKLPIEIRGIKKLIYMSLGLVKDGKRLAESGGYNSFSSYISDLVKKDRDKKAIEKVEKIISSLQ